MPLAVLAVPTVQVAGGAVARGSASDLNLNDVVWARGHWQWCGRRQTPSCSTPASSRPPLTHI
eukprot:3941846-Rhodomonas_salina.1